jgi:putative ABC transport system permease protein
MRAGPVARAVTGGLSRRRVQTAVIALVVLVSATASMLALALVADSAAPFDHAFAARRGAQVAAVINPAKASPAQLAATTRLAQVTAAAGPFAQTSIGVPCSPVTIRLGGPHGTGLQPMTLAGRAIPGGPVDDIALVTGHWVQRPGQVVLQYSYMGGNIPVGSQLTVTGLPGTPALKVVGLAASITGLADGWVAPAEVARLRPPGAPASVQMLYRFRDAGTAAAIGGDISTVTAALPAGAVTGTQSYLAVKTQDVSRVAVYVPFVIAFGVIGLVLSVLVVANVVSGAVVAGYSRIGVLKSIGFTPGQVVAAYSGQGLAPAAAGCLAGVVLGNLLVRPLLAKAAISYGVGVLGVPAWADVAVPVVMCCLTAAAAMVPALRAGRLSAVAAIAAGRAPRAVRGFTAHRLAGRLPLPRPVTIGLAAPFARPARTAVTLAAIALGAAAVTLAAGLDTSLSRVHQGTTLAKTVQERVFSAAACGAANGQPVESGPEGPPGSRGLTIRQQRTVEAVIRAQSGTAHAVAEADTQVSVTGLAQQVPVAAFRGDAAWTGYPLISGHWYTGPGQADVPTGFLAATRTAVGDIVTITFAGRPIPVRIVGEVFQPQNHGLAMFTSWQTLASADHHLEPDQYVIGLRHGIAKNAYAVALAARLGPRYAVLQGGGTSTVILSMLALIGSLTTLLALAAGLGVLNTVVLHTTERVHDLGVFKAIGMTPRQAIAMVVCWVAGTGLAAGVAAVPAGIALHRYVLPVMAAALGTGLAPGFLNVYNAWEITVLTLAGLVIAVAGALLPATWAARTPAASALRAE